MQGASQLGDFGDGAVTEVGDQLGGVGAGLVGIGELVKHHEVLGNGPGQGGLSGGVAGDQAGVEPGAGLGREPVAAAAQHAADAIQRVAGTAAVSGDVVLDAATDVIDAAQASLTTWKGSRTRVASGS